MILILPMVMQEMRPQFPVRFRDDAQYERVRKAAEKEGQSINEWLLVTVDAGLRGGAKGSRTATGIEQMREQGAANLAKKSRSVPPSKGKESAPVLAVGKPAHHPACKCEQCRGKR